MHRETIEERRSGDNFSRLYYSTAKFAKTARTRYPSFAISLAGLLSLPGKITQVRGPPTGRDGTTPMCISFFPSNPLLISRSFLSIPLPPRLAAAGYTSVTVFAFYVCVHTLSSHAIRVSLYCVHRDSEYVRVCSVCIDGGRRRAGEHR